MIQQGRPLTKVRQFPEHKDIKLTLRYAHLAPEHLRAAAASLDTVLRHDPARAQAGHKALQIVDRPALTAL